MTHPIPAYPNQVPSLNETIWANSDAIVLQWRGSPSATTYSNLYQYVDSDSDSDYVILRNANVITSPSGTRDLRFGMETPSGEVNPYQTVELRVRARGYNLYSANPSNFHVTIKLFEDGSMVTGSGSTQTNMSYSTAEYSHFLSTTAINNVSNWANVEVDCDFYADGIALDGEITIDVYRVRIIFS